MNDLYTEPAVQKIIDFAIEEDLQGADDLTVQALVPDQAQLHAVMTAKASGVICGVPLFEKVCDALGGGVDVTAHKQDGDRIVEGDCVLEARGSARVILIAERTALNLMQRISATATAARAYVDAIAGTKAKILDTRKTTPGLRILQKYAVVMGGGENHRIGLYDQILIKENHIALMDASVADSNPATAVARSREHAGPDCIIEVEIETLDDLDGVIEAGANIVLLDNMGPDLLAKAIEIRAQRAVLLEASGGITLESIRAVAESGVDRISVGALTHSVPAFDLSLRCDVS